MAQKGVRHPPLVAMPPTYRMQSHGGAVKPASRSYCLRIHLKEVFACQRTLTHTKPSVSTNRNEMTELFEKLKRGENGIRLYGLAPPKLATEPARLEEIAANQLSRLRDLAPDGLVVYDIQDEPGPAGKPRPFPFLPTVDPEVYAHRLLAEVAIPKIVYRSVGAQPRDTFSSWLDSIAECDQRLSVFVGAGRGRAIQSGMPLSEAYALARHSTNLLFGGICIAERHASKEDEHERMLAKQEAGCRFFISQSVYNASSTKSLLSDYAIALEKSILPPVPIILTFSPCGSVRTLEFMKWLGISFPRWLENELRYSEDTLARSVDLCEREFDDIQQFAREKRLPIGINVESISIRKSEVEASVELYKRLSSRFSD